MIEIKLTREQMHRLATIAVKFPDAQEFIIQETHESGIGATHKVILSVIDEEDTAIDITDVSVW